ncbi:MAG: hypothetical protein WC004_00560 [Candidatus Absconditabacterales bacterium]
MLLFILYRVGLGCLVATIASRECAAQKKLTYSKEIATIIDHSFDQSISYVGATIDIDEYVKPSLHYIYDAYMIFNKDEDLTPSQDSAVLFYHHFQGGFFFGHGNLNYDTTCGPLPRNPILSRTLRKGDCDDMALLSYTYACLKGIPCCMFVIEGGLGGKPGHVRFAMEKHVFQQTDAYRDYLRVKKRYAHDKGLQAHYDTFLNPLEVVVDGKTYCFFDEALNFTHDLSQYTSILSERGLDGFEDIQIIDNGDVLQYLRDNNMTEFFQEEFSQ